VTPEAETGSTTTFVDPVEILLVDDDQAWARGTTRLLEHANNAFSVTTATSLEAGHDQYLDCEIDCLVCDYQLGDGTGLGLLETVRDREPDLPFILVTGRGDERLASIAIRNDITDYVIKEDDDGAELLADCIASAVRSYRAERALERERRSKSTLLELLTAHTDETSLCSEFCSMLVDYHGYGCAWIASKGASGIVARATAGDDTYVDSLCHDTPSESGDPTLLAIETDEPVVREVSADAADDKPWRTLAREHGFETAASFPLDYEGVQFGVLGVYSTGRPALDAERIDSLTAFADTLGYALQEAEFKQSLGSDRSVGVEIEIRDPSAPLVAFEQSLPDAPRLVTPSILLRDDGTTLYLVRSVSGTADDVETAIDACEALTFAEGQTVTENESVVQCGVVADGPTPESLLAEQGAHVHHSISTDGSTTVTASLSEHRTVGMVAETLRSNYDSVVIASVRHDHRSESLGTVESLLDPLTDKQERAIEHAYYEGFFEHPRDITATELADQFNVTRQTVTHHLRAAERKLLAAIFERNP